MEVISLHLSSFIFHPMYILWNPSLTFGPFRWYSLCWLIGLALAYFIVRHLFYEQGIAERTIKKNGKKEVENVFDPLFIYCFLGILIGARLGHCLFYQPDYFLTSGKHIVEMFLPIHFMADGGWKFTGYEGLASHGGTLGLMIALWLYVRYSKIGIWTVLDNIAIATGTTACFIRLGNLMNSEIIGKVTDVPWAFIFERVDNLPRHPGQLYEAIAYAILFFIMWAIYKRSRKNPSTNTQHPIPTGGHGLVFRILPLLYLHVPIPHRVHQGRARGLGGRHAVQYGAVALRSVYHHRIVLHD